jgi:hypothetical protein
MHQAIGSALSTFERVIKPRYPERAIPAEASASTTST